MRVDAVEEWSRAQQRVIDLVADLPPERADLRVPACPDWTVRDLLSHMVGLGADVVAGDEPDDHNAEVDGAAGAGPPRPRRRRAGRGVAGGGRATARLDAGEHGPSAQRRAHPRAGPARGARGARRAGRRGLGRDPRTVHRPARRAGRRPAADRAGRRRRGRGSPRGSAGRRRGGAPGAHFDLPAPWSPAARPHSCGAGRCAATSRPYLDAFAMLGPLPSTDLTES